MSGTWACTASASAVSVFVNPAPYVVVAAAKQSRRTRTPEVAQPASTKELVHRVADSAATLVLHEDATTPLATADLPTEGEVLLVVGPEGGIAPEEIAACTATGAVPVRLGAAIRTSGPRRDHDVLVVGAGFASGQEAMQFFVAFGKWGLWGIALAAGLMMITGVSILQLGSYFQAEEHTAVYDKVASPFTAKILDWSTLVTLFAIGFVMFAGGGSNINQQFPSIPVWVGATAMLILVLLVGLMDVDRVTAVIGTITPFIIIFVVLATGYTIVNADVDFSAMNDWAVNNVDTSLPNWWLSALNYTGLNVMTAVSMSIVIGGNFLDNRAVGIGGLIGGLLYLILLALLVFALFFMFRPAANAFVDKRSGDVWEGVE